jgi:hypothetical protein
MMKREIKIKRIKRLFGEKETLIHSNRLTFIQKKSEKGQVPMTKITDIQVKALAQKPTSSPMCATDFKSKWCHKRKCQSNE